MTNTLYCSTPEVKQLVAAAFPGYRGKSFKVEPFNGEMHLTSYWDGGCRDYWAMVHLATGRSRTLPENGTPFSRPAFVCRRLPPGIAIVNHHHGMCEYVRVIVHPENLNRLALPVTQDMTNDERIVLAATCGLKSSYAGISNYRFHEAHQDTGITLEQWDAAKATCIAKGLLNRAGAITEKGRNAIGNTRLDNLKAA